MSIEEENDHIVVNKRRWVWDGNPASARRLFVRFTSTHKIRRYKHAAYKGDDFVANFRNASSTKPVI